MVKAIILKKNQWNKRKIYQWRKKEKEKNPHKYG
jgi:hypothetical protein